MGWQRRPGNACGGLMTETRTTCPYCGVGCGVVARMEGEAVSVRGDETHPA
ncbi:MAG: hypothetical protein DI537_46965, partial [Stutzerimonas stutzeri]